jgi:acetoin utilization protein AcuB
LKRIPSIAAVMTPFPYSIPADADISEARAMMEEHSIAHLPVMENGQLSGVIRRSDLRVADGLQAQVPSRGVEVGRVCNRSPLIVDLHDRLDRVAVEMYERGVEAVLVLRQDKLAGILTTTDVCRLLAESLRAQYHVHDDDGDAA